MGPDELIEKLRELRVFTSRRTLLRYEKKGLISEPVRGNHGRGLGRFTEYSALAPYEYYASWYCMKCYNPIELIVQARERGLKLWNEYKDASRIIQIMGENCSDELALLIPQWIHFFLELNPDQGNTTEDNRKLLIHRWKVIITKYHIAERQREPGTKNYICSEEEIRGIISAYENATGEKIKDFKKTV